MSRRIFSLLVEQRSRTIRLNFQSADSTHIYRPKISAKRPARRSVFLTSKTGATSTYSCRYRNPLILKQTCPSKPWSRSIDMTLLLLLLFCSLSGKNLCHASASSHLSLNAKLPLYQSHGVIGPWLPLLLSLTSLTRSLSASRSPLATGSGNQPIDKLDRLCSFLFCRRFLH